MEAGDQKCLRVLGRYRMSFPVGEPRYQLHAATTGGCRGDGAARAAIGAVKPRRPARHAMGGGAAGRRWRAGVLIATVHA